MTQLTPFKEDLRGFVERLRQTGELIDLQQAVDIRHIATLVDQSDKAILFHRVIGYDMPVLSGIVRTQKRAVMSVGCETFRVIEDKLQYGIDHPIAATRVSTSSTEEIIWQGDEVDFFKLPIPMS